MKIWRHFRKTDFLKKSKNFVSEKKTYKTKKKLSYKKIGPIDAKIFQIHKCF